MLSYHGNVATKRKYLRRVRAHRAADNLIQGTGWTNGKGCAVGCTLENYDHSRYPIELGVPQILARLEDSIFEGLPRGDAMAWPERFLSAVPVGRDLAMVWPRFAQWMLGDLLAKEKREDIGAAIRGVLVLYDRWTASGVNPDAKDWRAARDAAADAGDANAASAAASDARRAARHGFWRKAADKLEQLLRTA